MRIREADPPGDALLLKGSEGRGEAVAALPFPGAGRGNVPSPFAPVQRPVPLPGAAVAAAAQGTPGPVEAPQRRTRHVLVRSGIG